MSASNNRAGFRVFDVEDQDDADPTEENMPKKLSERIPLGHVILWDVPVFILALHLFLIVFGLYVLGMHNPQGILFTKHSSMFVFVLDLLIFGLGSFGLVIAPLHLFALIFHKKWQREEIINWGARGWVRTGLEPDKDMMEEIRRRRPYRPNQRR
ncbi:MAG TPA: hypothetical protein VFA48_05600 [Gammaproteobacteria bacterium]|nr:hypothetical protein [Gammaproteobacteria bacterium]